MRIVLLGEQEKLEFVSLLKEHYEVEWISNLKNIVAREFTFVIIMTNDVLQSAEIRSRLIAQGIAEEKILEYCYFIKNPCKSQLECFEMNSVYDYDGFWFGMSHSYGGLIEDLIKRKTIYKFSAPSMDLYYHYQILKRLDTIYDLKKIKKVYFELPYYIFNYDVSKCPNTFVQRINFFYYLRDYHHFGESQFGQHHIYMFEKMNELTGNSFYSCFWNSKIDENIKKRHYNLTRMKRTLHYAICKKEKHHWSENEIKEIGKLNPHVWYKEHINTLEENRKIWKSIIEWMDAHKWIEMEIVVFPFCPYFIQSNQEAIEIRKNEFFNELDNVPYKVIDMFEQYINQPEYFADECHLNMRGAYHFSKLLNRLLK